jgi:hypothetical protein
LTPRGTFHFFWIRKINKYLKKKNIATKEKRKKSTQENYKNKVYQTHTKHLAQKKKKKKKKKKSKTPHATTKW